MLYRILLLLVWSPAVAQTSVSNTDTAGSGYLTVQDHRLYFEKSGEGPAVLLLHGGYLDSRMWKEQVQYLNKKGFTTILLDDLGHGKTINGKEKAYAHEIIEALIDELQIDQVSIVGLSWGSLMAVDYALHYPARINKLVLISPGLNGWQYYQDKRAEKNYLLRQQAKEAGNKDLFVEYFQKNWTDGPGSDSLRVDREIRSQIGSMIQGNVQNHWQEDWSALETPPASERLGLLKCQTLIITGTLDGRDIQLIAEKMEREIPEVRSVEISKVAHTLNLERPGKVNRLLRKFLK